MSKTHMFRMEPEMWRLVETGVKTAECRIGDKAQRVRPGDILSLVNIETNEVLRRRVEMMMLYPTFAAACGLMLLLQDAGFDTWGDFEAAMRKFYGHRVNREPFTVMYLEKEQQ